MNLDQVEAGVEVALGTAAEEQVGRGERPANELMAEVRWRYLLALKLDMRTFAALDIALEKGTITFDEVPFYARRAEGEESSTYLYLVENGRLSGDAETQDEVEDRAWHVITRWFNEAAELIG